MTEKDDDVQNLLADEGDTGKILHPKDSKKREDIENIGKEQDSSGMNKKLSNWGKKSRKDDTDHTSVTII